MWSVQNFNVGETITVKDEIGCVKAVMTVYRLGGILRYPIMKMEDGKIKTACFGMCDYGFFVPTPGLSVEKEIPYITHRVLPGFFGPKIITVKKEKENV